ncbi:MAG: hypothetical protein Kow00107_01020 [Planctomycetota bacterium]
MNSARLSIFLCLVLMFAAVFTSGYQSVAEEAEITLDDQTGWFGVYVGGQKVGFAYWAIEKKTGSDAPWYKVTLDEERKRMVKDKEVKETFSFNGALTASLLPKSLKYEENRAGRKTILNAKIANGVAEIEVQFAGQPAMPAQKTKILPETVFNYCAPLVFAWRMHPKDATVKFSRLLEMGRTVVNCDLTAEEATMTFQGEEVTCYNWSDPEKKYTISTDGNGRLFYYLEIAKNGTETKYISEPEDVAKTSMTFEEKAAKDKEKNAGNKKNGKKNGGGVDWFDDALDPIGEDEGTSAGPRYFKLNVQNEDASFSMRAADGWVCGTVRNGNNNVYVIVQQGNQDHFIILNPIRGSEDDAEEQLETFITNTEESGNWANVKYVEEIQTFELGDKECAGAIVTYVANNSKTKAFVCLLPGEEISFVLLCIAPEDDFEDYQDDFFAMCGSARYE